MKKSKLILLLCIFLTLGLILGRVSMLDKVYKNENDNSKKIKDKDMLSMMIEQTAGAGDYVKTETSSWPTDGYLFNSTLSKCENGGEVAWDSDNNTVLMMGNTSDKCYIYFDKILTISGYVKSLYTGVQGENNLYYHDGTLTNGAGDNSYRYAGASSSVNNYVCFGSTENICPNDNLYRIIGVFEDQVKLIKADYANSNLLGTDGDYSTDTYAKSSVSTYKGNLSAVNRYYWNYKITNSVTNTWSTGLLNKTNLNTNYINNIGSEWASKIAQTTWKVGGNTYDNIYSQIPSAAYQNEIVNPVTTNTTDNATEYSAKIGLMYVSDYGFAAGPSAWTLTMGSYDNSTATSSNWLYLGMFEWTISRDAEEPDFLFLVSSSGDVGIGGGSGRRAVRPVFFLKSSVTYLSGIGISENPFRLS